MLIHSLTLTPITTTPNSLLRLRLPTKPSPVLRTPIPDRPNKCPLLLYRLQRPVLRAKDKTFNVEVDAEEEDSGEQCLSRFNREVARTGLCREWWRRRFHENAREMRIRKQREAALLRRRRYQRKRDSLSPTENADMKDDFWASDDSFDALINDEDVSNEEIESRFQDDGEGTWKYLDGTSAT